MSDQDNIFNNKDNENTPPSPPSSPEDLLSSIVREDGTPKYDTVEKALGGLAASQAHIAQLEAEAKQRDKEVEELREQANSQKSINDILERLSSQQQQPNPQETPVNNGLDEEKTKAIVLEQIKAQQLAKSAEDNYTLVQNTLVEKFGDKAREEINRVAKDIGMTPEQMGELAKTSPKAVLAYFNSTSTPTPSPAPLGSAVPPTPKSDGGLAPPEKNLLQFASQKDQAEYMQKIKDAVYKKYDVQT